MSWSVLGMVASLTGALLLVVVYGYLNGLEGRGHSRILVWAWIVQALRYAVGVASELLGEPACLQVAYHLAAFGGGLLLVWGTRTYLDLRTPPWAALVALVGATWIVYASMSDLPFLALALPTFLLLGLMYGWAGATLLRTAGADSRGARVAGWCFIVWGVHKLDYAVVRPIAALAPWGYVFTTILEMTLALAIAIDALERVRAVARSSAQEFRFFADHAQDLIFRLRLRPTRAFQYVSPSSAAMIGYTPEEHYADPDLATRIVHPDDRPILEGLSGNRGERQSFTLRWVHKDGHAVWTEHHNTTIRDSQGNAIAIDGIVRDVTDRMLAERALREAKDALEDRVRERTEELTVAVSDLQREARQREAASEAQRAGESRFQAIFQGAGIGMALLGSRHQIVAANSVLSRMLATREEELIGVDLASLIHPDDLASALSAYEEMRAGGRGPSQGEQRLRRSDGKWVGIRMTISPLGAPRRGGGEYAGRWSEVGDGSDGDGFAIAMIEDLGPQRHAEEERKRTERQLQAIADASPTLIFAVDLDNRYFLANRRFEQVTGRSRDEIIGRSVHECWPPDAARDHVEHYRCVRESPVPIEMEDRVQLDDGLHIFLTVKFPLMDSDGRCYAVCGIATDITEREHAEAIIHALNGQLQEQLDRLGAVNRDLESFTYTVSHDLRAPLRAIDGFSRIVLEERADLLDDEGRRWLGVIRINAQLMGRLIDDLLAFAHLGRHEMRSSQVDMASMARAVCEEVRGEAKGREILVEIGDLPPIRGDPALLRQVWVNLLANAVKFTRGRSPAVIQVGAEQQDGEVHYHVRDNGVGFDMRYVGKIFGVFQRLHSAGEFEGTGVGTAIVQRVVQRHGGRVWAEGIVGEGATFHFALPAREREEADGIE